MKVWLVTWEWDGDSTRVVDRVAAVLDNRYSSQSVARFVEFLYARATSNVKELLHYARHRKNNPYQAKIGITINDISHGDRIVCGANPYLYARFASNFSVNDDVSNELEIVSWTEPDSYKFTKDGNHIEIAQKGEKVNTKRCVSGPLCDELIWNRSKNNFYDKIVISLKHGV